MSFDDLVYIHNTLVIDFAGSDDPIEPAGIRDANLLHSAIGRLTTTFAGHSKYQTLPDAAASLFYGICQNHAFHNGNKRAAVVSMLCFLDRNGCHLETTEDELFDLVTNLAAHKLIDGTATPDEEVEHLAQWTAPRVRQVEKVATSLRFHQFRSIATAFDCEFSSPDRGYITVSRQVNGKRLRQKIPYHGDTKELDVKYLSQMRRALHLDEEHGCDSAVFYRAAIQPSEFISRYRVLLRRLAHV